MFGWDDQSEKQSNGIIIIRNYGIYLNNLI